MSGNGHTGYTDKVKTAVSIPDYVFREADELAARLGWSRSRLYAEAVREFLERQDDDPVTAALNALADEIDTSAPPDSLASARELIDRGDWEW